MGFAKNQMIEFEERGYGSSDKLICAKCIGDKFLKSIIKANKTHGICDYCDSKNQIIELEELMQYIMVGIYNEYTRAIDELGYNSREGGYLGTTWESYDVIYDDIVVELGVDDTNILDDIYDMINDETWCKRNPYALREDEDDIFTWNSFCHQLKHEIRYVFFFQNVVENFYERYRRPSDILERIGEGITELGLVSELTVNTPLFRGRMHNVGEQLNDSKSLGSPPKQFAGFNRMNPEGISMFYGAFNSQTVVEEIKNKSFTHITIGKFNLTRNINVIDLSKLDDIEFPSLFDVDLYERRLLISFYREFVSKITEPVGDHEKLEYIPTQVVTEYFRHVYNFHENKIDGIIYRSAKNTRFCCVVIFADSDECSDEGNRLLKLDKKSLKTILI